jgi:hypothetical protein
MHQSRCAALPYPCARAIFFVIVYLVRTNEPISLFGNHPVTETTFLVWQPPSHGFPTAQFHSLTFGSHLWVVDFPTDELCLTTALYTIYV